MTSLQKHFITVLLVCISLILAARDGTGSTKLASSGHDVDGIIKPVSTGDHKAGSRKLVSTGHYGVGNTRMELRDNARGHRKVTFEAWYPVPQQEELVEEGKDLAEKFPVICFAHGYQHPGDRYGNLVDTLVPSGYIMLALTTFEGPFPSHRGYAEEIRFLAGAVAGLCNDTLSPLFGIADTLICLMGHSMGGGALFHAAADNGNIDAIIALAPYDTRPSAIEAAGRVGVPTLIFSGTADCITPPEKNHLPMYERSAAEDKTYISIINGSHCGMGALRKCFTAEKLAGCNQGLGTEEQTAILARYMIPWLDCFLKGETAQGELFNRTLVTDETVNWLQSRPLPEPDTIRASEK